MSEGFFHFRSLVSTTVIKVIYIMGMIFITIGSLLQIVVCFITASGNTITIEFLQPLAQGNQARRLLFSIAILILGNLFWRLFCEAWILIFSLHEILASIEKELKHQRQ